MLKAAIVGCGKIADSHAAQMLRIPGCEITAVCDREPLMAQQLADRFPIRQAFSDLGEMLSVAKPDVVHITTPPESHFNIARQCLDGGAHVYVEKPFTLYADEARRLIHLAEQRGLKITAGHDDQFSHAARRMRTLVNEGFIGEKPFHMESYYGYELGRTGYAGALLGDKNHWVRRLPGKLLHNIISHGIARIAEFLSSDTPHVIAHGFRSPYLRQLGETEIIDELRVIVSEPEGNTAYFTFSSHIRPTLHHFRVFGPKNGIMIDQDQETVIKLNGKRYPSYAEKFVPPVTLARQYLSNLSTNMRTFMANDFHMKSGMKFLIESFYKSIQEGAPLPITYREIVLTAHIMDEIFTQLDAADPRAEAKIASARVVAAR